MQHRQRWLSNYPFERFVTLTFAGQRNIKYVEAPLTEWKIDLLEEEAIQIAYIGVIYITDTQTHIHLLMLGKNRFGKTLLDVDGSKWEKRWTHGKAEIEQIENEIGADFYIQSHMSVNRPDSWTILGYNKQLLKQLRYKQTTYSVEDAVRLSLS
jgi:hypothetical protein